jgi:signal peptidase II
MLRPISRRRRLTLAAVAGGAVLTVDQATKAWAQGSLPYNRYVPVIDHWVGFGLVSNSGAAFGSLRGRNALITILAAVLMVLIVSLLIRGTLSDPLTAVALGVIVGGGLSNLIDRVRLSFVTDFIVVKPWPSDFNLADLAIRLGAVTLVAGVLARELRRPRPG